MENLHNGCLWVWQSDRDFLFWSTLVDIKYAPRQDSRIIEYNQYSLLWWKLRAFCTVMSPISVISSIYNIELTASQFQSLWDYATQSFWYEEGIWNYTQTWCDCARKWWNLNYPDKKVVYFRTNLLSTDSDIAKQRNYWLVVTYRGNSSYNSDYQSDKILNGTSFGTPTYWHATSNWGMWWVEFISDTSKWRSYNRYNLKDLAWLVRDWTYYPTCYIFIPDPDGKMYNDFKNYEEEKKEAVERAKSNNISNGEELDRPITREESIVMLKRFSKTVSPDISIDL